MLTISRLSKSYGEKTALKNLDLTVQEGALFGLMGQNGAGKTTLLKITAGLLLPDSGTIGIDGVDALARPRDVRHKIGYVPDDFGRYENLRVSEYMDFFATAFGLTGRTGRVRCEALLEQAGLSDRAGDSVDELSRGMQQRLSIARALIHDPGYLILDEPTSGLDPGSRFSVREMLLELCEQGKTVLISSHVLSELSEICTDIGILEEGKVKVTGEVTQILDRIAHSNPLRITVLNGRKSAAALLRAHPLVQSLTMDGNTFSIEFSGGKQEEAELLRGLIESDIPVSGFMREPGSLESFFLRMTGKETERMIISDDSESDL